MYQAPRPSGTLVVATSTVVVGEIPGEPPGFVDRAELAELACLLDRRGRAAVCAGGRGVGKSALAAAYARNAIADAGPAVVVWVSGETEVALLAGLTLLAHRANLSVDGEDIAQAASRARDYLSGLGVPGLLVVDNAENPDLVARWLPTGVACQVLLTSTDQTFTALAAPVPVGPYTRAQSATYLTDRTGLGDPAGADRIADALGDLPLALAQAVGVITAQHLTYARYLDKLAAAPLGRALPAAPGYPRGLAEAIHLSVQATTDRHPHAAPVLDVLAVLDPNGITRTLLTDLLASPADAAHPAVEPLTVDDVDDVDDIVGVLATASLITVTADASGVVMHRLVARSLRENQPPGGIAAVLKRTATGLRSAIPGEHAPPPEPAFVADLTSQTLALLDHTGRPELTSDTAQGLCHAATAVGVWLYAVGAYADMLTIDEATLTARERVLGPDHPDTLASRNNLALGYQAVGRHGEAITLHEATLTAMERVLGPDHPDTLNSRNNLAVDYRAVGPPRRGDHPARGDPDRYGAGPGPRPPRHPELPQQPRRRLLGGRPPRRGDHPGRGDPDRPGTGPGPRPPRHPELPQQPRRRLLGGRPPRRGDHPGRGDPDRPGAGPGPRPPRHPELPQQPRRRLPGGRPPR